MIEKNNREIASFNEELFKEISIDELETRLELAEAPKTCGQYTERAVDEKALKE